VRSGRLRYGLGDHVPAERTGCDRYDHRTRCPGNRPDLPLDLATTVAELFIGFLVAAASNRSERNLETTLDRIRHQGAEIARLDTSLGDAMTLDTELSRQVKELLEQNTELTRTVEKLTRQVHAVVCAVTPDASQAGPGNGE
jgi:hypothetical protein